MLRKESYSEDELIKIKSDLWGKPLQDMKFNSPFYSTAFPVFLETKNKLYVPKMYGLEKLGRPKTELKNYRGDEWDDSIVFKGELFPTQKEPVNLLMNSLKAKGGGILSMQTGGGKTICCLNVLSQLKKRALIIVNKITLLKQWEREIGQFLPNAKVGIVQGQKKVDVEGKDIILVMLQSLSIIDYPVDLFDGIGCTVADEVHNMSSKVFSKALMKTCSEYTIGLSATPQRSDGCEYVFKWFIGDIVFKSTSVRTGLPPMVNTIKIKSNDYKEIVSDRGQIQYTSMISDLISMEKRNVLIINLIKQAVERDSRRVLVLSDRRDHLKRLKSLLDADTKVIFTYGLFVGQMKIADLDKSKASQVILATYQAFGEGVSEKDLDTLILATPKKFIGHLQSVAKRESGKLEQIVGRIFRKEHTKLFPLIIDLHDNFSVYRNQSRQRMIFYKEHFPMVQFRDQSICLDDHSISEISVDLLNSKKQKNIIPIETCLIDEN